MPEDRRKPDEEEIEAMLRDMRPQPGARFYRRMQSAPWFKPQTVPEKSWRRRFSSSRLAAAAIALILIFGTGALSLPTIKVVAGRLLNYFSPAPQDSLEIKVTLASTDQQTRLVPNDFPLSLEQAAEKAGFALKQPQSLPPGLSIHGAQYDSELQAVTLHYSGPGLDLYLMQRRLGNIEEYASIGASAPVETVQVRGITGEFVRGSWRLAGENQTPLGTLIPGTQTNLGVYWDTGYPQLTLRWLEGNTMYELRSSGETMDKEELIQIADSLR